MKKNSTNIIVLAAIVILAFLAFFVLSRTRNRFFTTYYAQNPGKPPSGPVDLPIDPKEPGVNSTYVAYNITGKVTKIGQVNNQTQLNLDVRTKNLPQLLLGPNVIILKEAGQTGSLSDIQVDKVVTVGILYDLRTKVWTTRQVLVSTITIPTGTITQAPLQITPVIKK